MSDIENSNFEKRLAALEQGSTLGTLAKPRRSPLLALIVALLISVGGALLYFFARSDEETALPTAIPDIFQNAGDGFGAIETLPTSKTPGSDIVPITAEPVAPNAALLRELAALKAQIEELRNTPAPVVTEDTATATAIDALTDQVSALQSASEAAQQQFKDALLARDRALEQLRKDLELAQLEANRPTPAPLLTGPTADELQAEEEERRRREAAERRRLELERRAAEERAFQERRITSPTIAFGGTSGSSETALTDRTFGDVRDFVRNGALPATVTQANIIANPANTIVQGTMIQAVMETALDSSLPGQIRALVSEDVFSFDGSRLLIPRGARLLGRYRSRIDIAQRRVTIAWDRIILQQNQTIQISSFGGDALGRSGVTGLVDTRFDERFGSAALISLIAATPSVAAGKIQNEATADVFEDVGEDLADATDSVISDYLSIGPVIYVDQGARITVMVDRDLEIF